MREICVAAAQFEARDGEKDYNLDVIDTLARKARERGAELISFHECSISGYTFLETLTREQLAAIAEPIPDGPSLARLQTIAREAGIAVGAGLIEREGDALYNAYVVVDGRGVMARHRKLHAFVSPYLTCGDRYTVFDLLDCRFGILTCYDNNLPENVRLTAMEGAEIILMPHVTGCLPSPMPGRGTVDPAIWHNRRLDPVRCRQEFDGPKGRGWLMRWLPARAWENGVFALFSNPIGVEGGTIKPGGAMILDPFGEVMEECRTLGDDIVVGTLDPRKRELASGPSYIRARRPELYGRMVEDNPHLGPDRRPEVWWQKHRTPAPV
ncbi:MAG TPA: nitrilase family protein [Bryobacteraceae bacterium]|jgi:predicted amidohydrolase|nr:nitrilase family protein [Bryobacteraceae bacterium]